MASATLLFLVLMLASVRVGKSAESLFILKCEPAGGIISQITTISCSIESKNQAVIKDVIITRSGEKKPCYRFQPFEKIETGDSRFKAENLPSLQLHNTKISDAGVYRYYIRTNLGNEVTTFTINVTAKYNNPIITSVPEEMVDDARADLYCNASGGYPAGTIHWFDHSNTNWTKSATLQSTLGNDGLFTLSSKLSFQKIDSLWSPFRCVVLNSRYEEEGTSTSSLKIKSSDNPPTSLKETNPKNIVAAVVVIGSLIIGLLIALLFKRRRDRQLRRASACPMLSDDLPEHTFGAEVVNGIVYEKAADSEVNPMV